MGGSTPKQFMLLGGTPVLQRTMEAFREALPQMRMIVVLPKALFSQWNDLCLRYPFNCPHTLVEGGLTRFHSVRNALEKVPPGAVVMVHDGVRPLLSKEMIVRMSRLEEGCRALVPALPVTDTLRSKDPSKPDPDRSSMLAVQTPQVFLSEDLKAAYSQAFQTSFTDDASVAAQMKIPICITEGEKFNIKLTTPEDMLLAEAILYLKKKAQQL